MGIGGNWNADSPSSDDEAHAEFALTAAIDAGISIFDHADIYGRGKAELVFGNFLARNQGIRSKLFIQTKAGIQIGAGPGGSNTYDLSRGYLLQQANRSLEKLKCEYLDAFILHRPDPLMDPAEVADTFAEMKEKGIAKQFGVSNFPAHQISILQKYWKEPLICNQIQFSIRHSSMLSQLTDANTNRENRDVSLEGLWAQFLGKELSLQAWGPLDRGAYCNGSQPEHSPTEAALADLVVQLANQYQTNPSAILLSWLFELPVNMQPVIGTTNPERIKDGAHSLNVKLSREDWYRLWITSRGNRLP